MRAHRQALPIFFVIGCIAGAVHWLVTTALIEYSWVSHKSVANGLGFLVSFVFSFFGHYFGTFRSQERMGYAIFKFFMTATLGFALNELIFDSLNALIGERYYQWHLVVAMAVVSVFTYIVARIWAFARAEQVKNWLRKSFGWRQH